MSNEPDDSVSFQTSNNTATHLGRKLYSTVPPALAELIANSYDAYAKKVHVSLGPQEIIVADNGVGMDLTGLNDRYAQVGRAKVKDAAPDGFCERAPMGKKGIGKLSAFSLGDTFEVYTKTQTMDRWQHFIVPYKDFVESAATFKAPTDSCDLPDRLAQYGNDGHGFIVVVKEVRRKITASIIASIKKQLSRRFYIRSGIDDFEVFLNSDTEALDLSANEYYKNIRILSYFGYSDKEIEEIFDSSTEISYNPFPINDKFSGEELEDVEQLIEGQGVKGWVGASNKPGDLRADGADFANIIVYINGKIADENLLKNNSDARYASQYIVGEIQADFLDDEGEDPITSSREGLDFSDQNVKSIEKLAIAARSSAMALWEKDREVNAVKRLPKWVEENQPYSEWREKLSPGQIRLNNELLKIVSFKGDQNELMPDPELKLMLNSFIDIVQNYELLNIDLDLAASLSDAELRKGLFNLLQAVSVSEQIKQANIVSERLQAIKKLEELIGDPTVTEKVFEDHLFDNPWLINPYWNRSGKSEDEIRVRRQVFNTLYDATDDAYKRTFIDILIEVADERYPIIIELKRNAVTSYSKVSLLGVLEQIKKYRFALMQATPGFDKIEESMIPAIFVGPSDSGTAGSGNSIEFTPTDLKLFETANVKITSYAELVQNARKSYREHIKVVNEQKKLPVFSVEE